VPTKKVEGRREFTLLFLELFKSKGFKDDDDDPNAHPNHLLTQNTKKPTPQNTKNKQQTPTTPKTFDPLVSEKMHHDFSFEFNTKYY
jgi:hypothetical protein